MKKILLISDSHSHLDQKLIKHIEAADEVWHAGDIGNYSVCEEIIKLKKLLAVYGNIDGQEIRTSYPEFNIFNCEKVKVLMTHIAGSPSTYNLSVREKIKETNPNILICGHSHILKVMYDKKNNLLFMNPGACGVHGFHNVKTAIKFEIEGEEIKNLAIIELGKRTST
ncbi:MAG: metallophosphoesterase family protein [Sphingobacteriaceae bacterium]|nr:metallophosphoesterase family protein [Sphingobacteriaceae bacterium]